MRIKQWFAASFLVIAGSVAFMLIFAYTGLLMYQFAFQEQRFEDDTRIAGVEVSNMHREEAVAAVEEAVNSWEQEALYQITWYDEEIEVPAEAVSFLVEPTVERLIEDPERREADLLVSADEAVLAQALDSFSFGEEMQDHVFVESLAEEIEAEAGRLPAEQLSWMVHPHLAPLMEPEQTLLTETTRSGAATPALQEALADAERMDVPGKTTFSTMEQLHLPGDDWVEEEALAALGSAVFETVAATNFEIEERHQRYALLDTVPLGFDAHLEQERRDFQFYNPNDYDYELEVRVSGTDLYVALYGYEFPYDVTVTVNESNRIASKTRVIYSNGEEELLGSESSGFIGEDSPEAPGETMESGEDGFRVETIRTISSEGASEDEGTQVLAEDYYAPLHAIEERDISVREVQAEEDETEDFPWDPEDWNGDGAAPGDPDDWMGNGGGDPYENAYEDWIEEGSPGEFEEWMEENPESFPGDGGQMPGFEGSPEGGAPGFGGDTGESFPGFDDGTGAPGFDGAPGPGGGAPGFDGSPDGGAPGFGGDTGESFPGFDDGTGAPGFDGAPGGGAPGFDGSPDGGAPGFGGDTGESFPGFDDGTGAPGFEGAPGPDGSAPGFDGGNGTPGWNGGTGNGVPDGSRPPNFQEGNGTGNGSVPGWDNGGENGIPGYERDTSPEQWFPDRDTAPRIKGEK